MVTLTPRSAGTAAPPNWYSRVTSTASTALTGGPRSRQGLAHGRAWPGLTRSAPLTTTRSPGATPDTTCTLSGPCTPSVTTTRDAFPSRTTQTASRPSARTTAAAGTVTASCASRTARWATALIPGRGVGAVRPSAYRPGPRVSRTWYATPPRADVVGRTSTLPTAAS